MTVMQPYAYLSFGSWKSSTAIGFELAAAGLAKDLNISLSSLLACSMVVSMSGSGILIDALLISAQTKTVATVDMFKGGSFQDWLTFGMSTGRPFRKKNCLSPAALPQLTPAFDTNLQVHNIL